MFADHKDDVRTKNMDMSYHQLIQAFDRKMAIF